MYIFMQFLITKQHNIQNIKSTQHYYEIILAYCFVLLPDFIIVLTIVSLYLIIIILLHSVEHNTTGSVSISVSTFINEFVH